MGLKHLAALNGFAIRLASLRYRPRDICGAKRDYQKFVVASYQRSGSTMLTSSLTAHSRAHCFGEIFNRRHAMLWTPGYDNDSRWLNAIRDHRPQSFLDRFVFRGYARDIDAVGFKVFPDHAQDLRFRSVVDPLLGDPGVKVIHLYRDNKLAVYVSLILARESGVWATKGGKRTAPAKVLINPNECASGLAELESKEHYFRDALENQPHLSVSYEELANDRSTHYGRVLDYLGLPYEDMSPHTAKQRGKALRDVIENFRELAERFSGTPYARHFEE